MKNADFSPNFCYNKGMKELDFEQYIREGEPDKREKSIAWSIATGLQQVDGLTPSPYLYETARRNIEGEITIEDAKQLIESYYDSKTIRTSEERREREADKVSSRIAVLIKEKSFNFGLNQLLMIHERLFKGVLSGVKAGRFRHYNITKREWALDGDTVLYAPFDLIKDTVIYDLETERKFNYSKLSKEEAVTHIAKFVANLWQIHPFGEGNTRTTAVFLIKYLRSLGFMVDNKPFEDNSWYFRNSLVRANYTNVQKSIYSDMKYLERFLRNLLLGEHNELKNRFTHIRYTEIFDNSSEKNSGEKRKSSEKILTLLKIDPKMSARELSEKIGISSRAVEKQLASLVQQGLLKHEGPSKGGHWIVLK